MTDYSFILDDKSPDRRANLGCLCLQHCLQLKHKHNSDYCISNTIKGIYLDSYKTGRADALAGTDHYHLTFQIKAYHLHVCVPQAKLRVMHVCVREEGSGIVVL